MLLTGIAAALAFLGFFADGSSNTPTPSPKPGPSPSPKPGPSPGPTPGPTPGPAGIPTIENVMMVVCKLFESTHAAAPPSVLVSDAYLALGTNAVVMAGSAPIVHAQATEFATRLYNGEIECESEPEDYAPSSKLCPLTGQSYNAALWHSPDAVYTELRALGFATGPTSTASKRTKEVKKFQALARSMKLHGLSGAPASYVDGIIGACTLVALDDAHARRLAGTWPANLAAASMAATALGNTAASNAPKNPFASMATKF